VPASRPSAHLRPSLAVLGCGVSVGGRGSRGPGLRVSPAPWHPLLRGRQRRHRRSCAPARPFVLSWAAARCLSSPPLHPPLPSPLSRSGWWTCCLGTRWWGCATTAARTWPATTPCATWASAPRVGAPPLPCRRACCGPLCPPAGRPACWLARLLVGPPVGWPVCARVQRWQEPFAQHVRASPCQTCGGVKRAATALRSLPLLDSAPTCLPPRSVGPPPVFE
jgi:hypothetical protein